MVYLAELSVCVTVWFKSVRIYTRRVPRVHIQLKTTTLGLYTGW